MLRIVDSPFCCCLDAFSHHYLMLCLAIDLSGRIILLVKCWHFRFLLYSTQHRYFVAVADMVSYYHK